MLFLFVIQIPRYNKFFNNYLRKQYKLFKNVEKNHMNTINYPESQNMSKFIAEFLWHGSGCGRELIVPGLC